MLFDQLSQIPEDQLNKLFCTFTKKDELDYTISDIKSKYNVLYSKVFVLEIADGDEYVCTYNIDSDNINKNNLLPSTILMHRRKETNTLYTINSLNFLVGLPTSDSDPLRMIQKSASGKFVLIQSFSSLRKIV